MSGIYIPGVELPPIDEYLHLRIDGNGYVSMQISENQYICDLYDTDKKAVELPPHGRLIDADALMDGWMNLREATKYGNETKEQLEHSYSTMMMYEIAGVIEDAPTIIPADGGVANV